MRSIAWRLCCARDDAERGPRANGCAKRRSRCGFSRQRGTREREPAIIISSSDLGE